MDDYKLYLWTENGYEEQDASILIEVTVKGGETINIDFKLVPLTRMKELVPSVVAPGPVAIGIGAALTALWLPAAHKWNPDEGDEMFIRLTLDGWRPGRYELELVLNYLTLREATVAG